MYLYKYIIFFLQLLVNWLPKNFVINLSHRILSTSGVDDECSECHDARTAGDADGEAIPAGEHENGDDGGGQCAMFILLFYYEVLKIDFSNVWNKEESFTFCVTVVDMFDDLFEDTSAEEDTVVNQVLDEIGIQINSQVFPSFLLTNLLFYICYYCVYFYLYVHF